MPKLRVQQPSLKEAATEIYKKVHQGEYEEAEAFSYFLHRALSEINEDSETV